MGFRRKHWVYRKSIFAMARRIEECDCEWFREEQSDTLNGSIY